MRTWARWTAKAAMFTASFVAAGAGTVGIANAGTTSGNNSIGGGNQVSIPISIPVNVCGNAVALLGGSFAFCEGGASVSHGSGGGASSTTSGNQSILGGNQVKAPVSVPVNVCGNAVGRARSRARLLQGRRLGIARLGRLGDGSSDADLGQPVHPGRQPGARRRSTPGERLRQRGQWAGVLQGRRLGAHHRLELRGRGPAGPRATSPSWAATR